MTHIHTTYIYKLLENYLIILLSLHFVLETTKDQGLTFWKRNVFLTPLTLTSLTTLTTVEQKTYVGALSDLSTLEKCKTQIPSKRFAQVRIIV